MADIGEVVVRLKADISDLERKLSQAQGKLRETATVAEASGSRLGVAFGASVGAAIAAIVGTLTLLTKQAISAAAELDRLSQITGISTKNLSILSVAAAASGTSVQQLATGLETLGRYVSGAGRNAEQFNTIMRGLHIATRDAATGGARDVFAVLGDLAEIFKRLPDGAAKTGLAFRTLGPGFAAWIPALNQGREGIERFAGTTDKLGVLVSTDFAKASDKFSATLGNIGIGARGVGQAIAVELLPGLQASADAVLRLEQAYGKLIVQNVAGFIRGIGQAIEATRPWLLWLNDALGSLLERWHDVTSGASSTGSLFKDVVSGGSSAALSQKQSSSDLERTVLGLLTQQNAELRKARELRDAIFDKTTAQFEAEKERFSALQRSGQLEVDIGEQRAQLAAFYDQTQSGALRREQELYALRVSELDIERQQLAQEITAAQFRQATAFQNLREARTPIDAAKAEAALIKAQSDVDSATAAMEDGQRRAILLGEQHKLVVAQITDEYLHLGDTIKTQLSSVVTGIALGTGSWKDAGQRFGQALVAGLVESTVAAKLANFDPVIKKNLLDLGTEGGIGAGINFAKGLLGGATGGTGAAGYAAELGTAPGFEAAMMGGAGGTGAGSLALGGLGAAALGVGAGSMLSGLFGGGTAGSTLGGAGGGALAGAMVGSIVPGIGTAIGAIVGGLVGALGGGLSGLFGGGPTQEHVNMDSIRDWMQKSGLTQAQGTLGGRPTWGDHSIIDRVFAGITDQAQFNTWNRGILAVMTAGLGNDKGQAGMATNAFANNEVLLGHSVERMKADLLKLAQAAGIDLGTALSKLEEQFNAGQISGEEFGQAVAQTAAIFDQLPAVIDTSVLALQALDEQGSVTFEHLNKVIEDAQSVISVGLADTFKKLVTNTNITDASKSLAQAYADTFVNRFTGEMLKGTLATKLTQAVADAERAAELLGAGDKTAAQALLAQAKTEFLAGRTEFLAGAMPIASMIRSWERSFGVGGVRGIIAEQLPSYDTPSMTRVPGAFGAPQVAMVHGGEVIRNPQHDDRIAAGIAEIASLLSGGLRGSVQNDLRIVLQLDGRDIAYGLQRVDSRQGTPGILMPQKIGRR